MFPESRPYTVDRIVRISITLGFLCGLVWLLGYLSDVLIPFAAAFLLAYLMNPLVVLVQKKVPNRAGAVFISLSAVLAAAVLLAWLVIPMIVNEIVHMGRILSEVVTSSDIAERAAKRLPPDLWQAIKDYAGQKNVQAFFKTDNFWKIAEAVARKVLPGVWGIISGTAGFITGLVGLTVVGLYLVFLLMDYRKMSQGWKDMLPAVYREGVTGFVGDFDSAMNRYFRAQALVASIVGVLFALGFLLIGLPMGILLGLFIGLLNMVPYLQMIGLIPAFLLALVHALETGSNLWMVMGLTGLVFVVIQIIQDTLLVPRIMGRVTGLSPAIILLSLSIWGKLLGVFGLLIALPLTCLLLAYYRRFVVPAEPEDTGSVPEEG
ncbi:MAG: AI-2E family transporter [Deltaproteobacteria bacterium]|nr:AI-2E family transporter [Deltaproteobacteria bacterium]MBW2116526.1 AI-2E family transporter [Deltaproteobacteria bacterium]MBW2343257.1 AI-2E family transporter [Deltaproteobacteria bacterium]